MAAARLDPKTASEPLGPHAADRLRLVTGLPFDAVAPGTPLRGVVTAHPLPRPAR